MFNQNPGKQVSVPLPVVKIHKYDKMMARSHLLLFVFIFAVLGTYFVWRSSAATPVIATVQAEQMTLPHDSKVIKDKAASGGQAVRMASVGTSLTGSVNLPSPATSVALVAKATSCTKYPPAMSLSIDGNQILSKRVASGWTTYSLSKNLASGMHKLAVKYQNGPSRCRDYMYIDVINFAGPPPPTPAPTIAFSANPTTINAGSSSTLTWTSTNASSCTASGSWSGAQPTSGSISTGALNANSTYTLACSGNGGTVSASAAVTVNPAPGGGGGGGGNGGAGDGTTGTLSYQENYVQGNSPLVKPSDFGQSGQPQACNYGFPGAYPNCGVAGASVGNVGKWFGNWYPGPGQVALPALAGVTNYAKMDANIPGSCPSTTGVCGLEAIGHHIHVHTNTWQQGQTTYNSFAIYDPAGGLPASVQTSGNKIDDWHFENQMNGEALQAGLFSAGSDQGLADHINLWGDMGACSTGQYCQWHIADDDNHIGWPTGSTYHLPPMHLIPPGGMVQGAWNEVIVKINWEMNGTGMVDAWYRSYNGVTHTAWQHSPGSTSMSCSGASGGSCPFPLTNLSTVQYAAGSAGPANFVDDEIDNYGYAVKADLTLYQAGMSEATGFAAAASALP